jgi:hypothetical protein
MMTRTLHVLGMALSATLIAAVAYAGGKGGGPGGAGIPEPAALVLVVSALGGVAAARFLRRKK